MCVAPSCPAAVEDLAVQYHLNRMAPPDRQFFEAHLSTCARCRAVADETRLIVEAMQDANPNAATD
jgi:hypothetical protein